MAENISQEPCKLLEKSCVPCEGTVSPLKSSEIGMLLQELTGWHCNKNTNREDFIFKNFTFKNYYETMSFVNAVAKFSHLENHHPVLEVSYQECLVKYQTHAIKGLSENDFICAAKANDVYEHFT